jgi:DUF4097 and DUF4098 domain-containing protein YvlB
MSGKMRKRTLGIAMTALWIGLITGSSGFAQDFQKSYNLRSEGFVRIRTISGDIKVQGYDGKTIIVEGFKVGQNRDCAEIVDRSIEGKVDIDVNYRDKCNCDINFQLRVPRNISYNFDSIRSISGDVLIADVMGHLVAISISGSVQVMNVSGMVSATATSGNVDVTSIEGIVTASSTSGNVNVYMKRVQGSGDMKFSSISGNVTVKAPADLDASVSISTLSGSLKTDFPIEIQQRRYVPGSSAGGRLGAGTHNLVIRSVSGRVSLLKIQI